MTSTVYGSLAGRIVRAMPAPLLRALDAWSYRLAQRRYEARQRKWLQHKAALATQAQAK